MSSRFIIVGPPEVINPSREPGVYQEMPFQNRKTHSPFPYLLQCRDLITAKYVFVKLQPLFIKPNRSWDRGPQTAVNWFVDSKAFKDVAQTLEGNQTLFWAVKQGRRTGVYTSTLEALNSVDSSGTTSSGRVFKLAYAFYNFREATVCQMLHDHPQTAVHTYDPIRNPSGAATLRATLLHEGSVGEESPEPEQIPEIISDSDEEPPQSDGSSVSPPPSNSSPKRRPFPTTGPTPVSIQNTIHISSNVNADGNFDRHSRSVSPIKRKAAACGVGFGRQLLEADRMSSSIKVIEELLLSSSSVDDFADAVTEEFGTVSKLKAKLLWDLYKLV
ncbi:hypothetical protein F5878DRAFT_655694 [Lentinula raphanica]|uniref:Uncharacterized protein n=1 Tax=Lentinula raphanica TaxID=153919 RepID=A0AA38PL78_9AGAR|nr:hypothetical protein F5878DRAFT_655694 [Lentinula raphanica]